MSSVPLGEASGRLAEEVSSVRRVLAGSRTGASTCWGPSWATHRFRNRRINRIMSAIAIAIVSIQKDMIDKSSLEDGEPKQMYGRCHPRHGGEPAGLVGAEGGKRARKCM